MMMMHVRHGQEAKRGWSHVREWYQAMRLSAATLDGEAANNATLPTDVALRSNMGGHHAEIDVQEETCDGKDFLAVRVTPHFV